jgi:hypothetical protein
LARISLTFSIEYARRADGKGVYWYLPPPRNGPFGDVNPLWVDDSFTWYPYDDLPDWKGMPVFVLKFKLPDQLPGFTDRAVVQW